MTPNHHISSKTLRVQEQSSRELFFCYLMLHHHLVGSVIILNDHGDRRHPPELIWQPMIFVASGMTAPAPYSY